MRSLPIGEMSHVARVLAAKQLRVVNAGTYDDGGLLHPGLNAIYNGTRRPERVLNDSQWQLLTDAATGGDGGDTINLYPRTLDFGVRDLELLQKKRDTQRRVGRPR